MQPTLPDRPVVLFGSYAPSLLLFRGPLISELVRRGHRVVALAPAVSPDVRDGLKKLGAETIEVPVVNNSLNPIATVTSYRALVRLFRLLRPLGVIAYTVKPVTLGALAAARAGVPSIVALITGLGFAFTGGKEVKRRISRLVATGLYRLALRKCTAILFQNSDDQKHFDGLGLLPSDVPVSIVNGSGIDLEAYVPAPLPHAPIFLMIARLLGDKGVREYGEAARLLKLRHPEARFLLVGYFDHSPDAISKAELDSMIDGGIEFLGRMDDVRPAIAQSSVYVLPSYREGTPRSVLEAMAMGRPIVTTDAPGCRETVEDGLNGFLVPPRRVDDLAAAMARFIADTGLAGTMGQRSRLLAERKYEAKAVAASICRAAGL